MVPRADRSVGFQHARGSGRGGARRVGIEIDPGIGAGGDWGMLPACFLPS